MSRIGQFGRFERSPGWDGFRVDLESVKEIVFRRSSLEGDPPHHHYQHTVR